MNRDFNLGRRYERSEVLYMLDVLRNTPDEELRTLLNTWEGELKDDLSPMKYQIVIEETYVIA